MTRNGRGAEITPMMADGYPVLEGTWRKGAPLPAAAGFSAIGGEWAKADGRVYFFPYEAVKTYIYDVQGDSWSAAEKIPTPRYYTGSIAVGQKLYCIGGRLSIGGNAVPNVEVFDTTTNTWTIGADLPQAEAYFCCFAVGELIFCIGQAQQMGTQVYNTAADSWEVWEDAPTTQDVTSPHAILDNKVYFPGGNGLRSDVAVLDLQSRSWSLAPEMPTPRFMPLTQIIGDKMYCISGHATNVVEIYDTASGIWHSGMPKPTTASSYALSLHRNQRIYCIGGRDVDYCLEVYDTDADTWYVAEDIPTMKGYYSACFFEGNRLYCIGSGNNMDVDIFQVDGEPEYLVRIQYQAEDGRELLADQLRVVGDGEEFSASAPFVDGYSCKGHRLDGGALQSGPTVVLEAVRSGHTITFVYKPVGGSEGNGGSACAKCGRCPCCCKKFEYQLATVQTVRTDDEDALKRLIDHIGGR